jgi:hypothetical protein
LAKPLPAFSGEPLATMEGLLCVVASKQIFRIDQHFHPLLTAYSIAGFPQFARVLAGNIGR